MKINFQKRNMYKKIIILIFTGFIFLLFNTSCLSNKNVVKLPDDYLEKLTTEQKLEDFNYFYNVIKGNYPYLEVIKRMYGIDWLSYREQFETWVKGTKTPYEFYKVLKRIIKLLQNGHTAIISPEWYKGYRKLYKDINLKAWGNLLYDKNVEKKYELWEKVLKNNENYYIVPVMFKYIEGEYIVIDTLNGKRFNDFGVKKYSILKSINGLSVDKYLSLLKDRVILKKDFKRNKIKLNSFALNGEPDQKFKLVLEYNNKNYTVEIKTEKYNSAKNQRFYRRIKKSFYSKILIDKKVAYIKFYTFGYEFIKNDKNSILKFYKSIEDYPYLIIDIRGNGGGSDTYWMNLIVKKLTRKKLITENYLFFKNDGHLTPFLKSKWIYYLLKPIKSLNKKLKFPEEYKWYFTDFYKNKISINPDNSIKFKGKIFLLVDDFVFSSAESFASFAKAASFATLVGTNTGGDGIGTDPAIMVLPNSGLVIRFPMDMGINPDGTSNFEYKTQPDIYVETTLNDYIKSCKYFEKFPGEKISKYDTILNKVLSLIKKEY